LTELEENVRMTEFRRGLTVLAALAASAGNLFALEVLCYNGQRWVGDVRLAQDTVFVKVDKTTYEVPRGSVKAIRLFGPEQLEYARRKDHLGETAEAQSDFARWLQSKFQYAEAETHYESTIRLDPEHKGAREALGYKRENGKWTLSEEDHWRTRSLWLGEEAADACIELAKLYRKAGDDKRVETVLRRALIAWPRHAAALALMRPFTDKYVSKNVYRLPVEGTWAVLQDFNLHHRAAAFMAYALDFVKVDDKLHATKVDPPTRVEDYCTWDSPVLAAADGEVYAVTDGTPDSPLGTLGEFWSANTVCIRHPHDEYTVYGHLKNGSIVVRKGQKVKAGDVIARGGNSGSSAVPHMHWAMYDRDGIGLPVTFSDFSEVTPEGEKKIESGRCTENQIYRSAFTVKP
jgi:tetratricopeptide (TPR) repeat protein